MKESYNIHLNILFHEIKDENQAWEKKGNIKKFQNFFEKRFSQILKMSQITTTVLEKEW